MCKNTLIPLKYKKHPKTWKMQGKKKTKRTNMLKHLNDQNSFATTKMTKNTSKKPLKFRKYSLNHYNNKNTPELTRVTNT